MESTPPVESPAPTPPASGAICPTCQQINRIGARHCRFCSGPLASTWCCPHCRAENRVQARYCRNCSQALMTNAPPRLGTGNLAPQTLVNNRYLTLRKIAQGGMGAVYLVSDTRLSKSWALKEMSETTFQPDQLTEIIEMFRTEATILAQLRHPNLPEVVDLFDCQSKYYLVMDYVEGETLEAILSQSRKPIPIFQVLRWSSQLCGVFEYLHDQQIIHRDLKPGNIMLEKKTGLLKIIDFGIARFQRKRTSKQLLQPGQSVDDAGIGTMGYAPPEQWRKGAIAVQADVYALGVVLHQLLTQHDPARTPFALPPIQSLNPKVPAPIADVIAKAYEPKLTERFQTIADFHRALSQSWISSFGGWLPPSDDGGEPA